MNEAGQEFLPPIVIKDPSLRNRSEKDQARERIALEFRRAQLRLENHFGLRLDPDAVSKIILRPWTRLNMHDLFRKRTRAYFNPSSRNIVCYSNKSQYDSECLGHELGHAFIRQLIPSLAENGLNRISKKFRHLLGGSPWHIKETMAEYCDKVIGYGYSEADLKSYFRGGFNPKAEFLAPPTRAGRFYRLTNYTADMAMLYFFKQKYGSGVFLKIAEYQHATWANLLPSRGMIDRYQQAGLSRNITSMLERDLGKSWSEITAEAASFYSKETPVISRHHSHSASKA